MRLPFTHLRCAEAATRKEPTFEVLEIKTLNHLAHVPTLGGNWVVSRWCQDNISAQQLLSNSLQPHWNTSWKESLHWTPLHHWVTVCFTFSRFCYFYGYNGCYSMKAYSNNKQVNTEETQNITSGNTWKRDLIDDFILGAPGKSHWLRCRSGLSAGAWCDDTTPQILLSVFALWDMIDVPHTLPREHDCVHSAAYRTGECRGAHNFIDRSRGACICRCTCAALE